MKKTESIKKIFQKLTNAKKEDVKYQLHKEYGFSTESIKNLWFYDGKIPEDKVDRVIEVLKVAAEEQISDIQDLIDVI
jgi:hypothetical protein